VARQGTNPRWARQCQARHLFTCCRGNPLQPRPEGKIRAADIDRKMQEAGHHSRHAKADRHGQCTASGPEEIDAKPSLTNTDTHGLHANHCRATDSFDFKAVPRLNKMQVLERTRLANGPCAARPSYCLGHVFDMTPPAPAAPARPTSPRLRSGRLPEGAGLSASLPPPRSPSGLLRWRCDGSLNEPVEARDERRLIRLPQTDGRSQTAAVKLPSSGLRGPTGATVPSPHRQVGPRPTLQDRRRSAVRNDLAAQRARRHPDRQQLGHSMNGPRPSEPSA